MLAAHLGEHVGIAPAAASEPEVLAHQHARRVQPVDEIARDEVFRGHRRELLVEPQHEGRVEPRRREQVDLLIDADHELGAVLGRDGRERIPIERHGDRARVARGGVDQQVIDDRAVPGVHAVELSDRDDRVAEVARQL